MSDLQKNPDNKKSADSTRKKAMRTPNMRKTTPVDQANDTQTTGAPPKIKEVEKVVVRDRGGIMISLTKAILYIAFVVITGAVIAYFGIHFANDIFAFVKDDVEATIEITEDMTLTEIADTLYRNDIIEYPSLFKLYFKSKSDTLELEPGEYTISATMNYSQIMAIIKKTAGKRQTIDIRITEGMTVDDIINQFVEKGIGKRERFVEVINTHPFDYPFVTLLDETELDEQRLYRLEGYLFPDTYQFYTSYYSYTLDESTGENVATDITEIAVIDKLLANFNAKFVEEDYKACEELGLTVDQVITLASMIEKEAYYADDFYKVSAVFHNRHKSSSFVNFGSDATLYYYFPDKTDELTREELETDTHYNTHIYGGFPPSAICNPGFEAIMAALYPDDSMKGYYYFVSDKQGNMYYAKSATAHRENAEKVDKINQGIAVPDINSGATDDSDVDPGVNEE